jgi:outer membrane protein
MLSTFLLAAAILTGDVPAETLTLKQAVDMALAASPEMRIVQAQQEGARQAIAEARSSFIPAVTVGSGAAYTRGALQYAEGQPPALAQAYATGQILNIPQRHAIQELRAGSLAVSAGSLSRRDDLIWRVATTYIDLDKTTRALELARKETESLDKLLALTLERVKEGQEIPSEGTRARLNLAKNRQRLVELQGRGALLEATLRSMLSLPEERRIRTVAESVPSAEAMGVLSDSAVEENRAVARAIDNSAELKKLALEVTAKEAHVKVEEAAKYPSMELIAQYGYFTRITRFETTNLNSLTPNNIQLGTLIKIPLFNKQRIEARVGEANAELTQARNQLEAAKRRIALEVRQSFQQSRLAGASREVAKLELDLARETTAVVLARFEEGRAGSRELEQARLEESTRWNALIEVGYEQDRAHLQLLKTTGEIASLLQR